MEKIALLTDSGSDLTLEELKENNVYLAPLNIIYSDGEFEDNSSDNESIKPRFYSKEEVKHLLETEEFASRTQIICDNWING